MTLLDAKAVLVNTRKALFRKSQRAENEERKEFFNMVCQALDIAIPIFDIKRMVDGLTLKEIVTMRNKQISMKPKKYTTESDICFYICPECEHYVEEETHHCEFCGQALDWSGDDDCSR